MKTKNLILGLLFFSSLMSAQVAINVNIGTAPAWGPVVHTERYYYLPEIETYYDIHTTQYIYVNHGRWTRAKFLPARHRHYDLYAGRKVILVDNGSMPYKHFHSHKVKYRPTHERPHYYADKHHNKHHHKKDKHHKNHKHGRGHGH